MLILIDEVGAKRTIILIKSQPHWCDSVECYWSLKFMLLGGLEKGTQRVVSRSVIIPHLQVFLLPWSLSSLVKRKSICTDVYEEWEIARRKRKEEKKGILMKEGQWRLKIDDLLLVCAWSLFVCSPDWLQLGRRCIRESSTMEGLWIQFIIKFYYCFPNKSPVSLLLTIKSCLCSCWEWNSKSKLSTKWTELTHFVNIFWCYFILCIKSRKLI